MAAIKEILESPTMATIWVKEATRRKLVRSKVKNMEMSLQVSLHWQSITWDYELLKPQVFFSSFCQTKPLQRRRKAKRIKRTWQNSLLIRSILSVCSSQLCGFVSNKTHVYFFFMIFLFLDAKPSTRHPRCQIEWRKIGCTATWVDGHPMSPESVFADILPSRTVEISSCGDQGKPSSTQGLHLSFQINMQVAIKYLVEKVNFSLNIFS